MLTRFEKFWLGRFREGPTFKRSSVKKVSKSDKKVEIAPFSEMGVCTVKEKRLIKRVPQLSPGPPGVR